LTGLKPKPEYLMKSAIRPMMAGIVIGGGFGSGESSGALALMIAIKSRQRFRRPAG
jgi:hypothetical protein